MAAPSTAPPPTAKLGPNVAAAYDLGRPCRPSVFDLSELLSNWGHVAMSDLDIPPCPGWEIVSWTCTTGKNSGIDLSGWAGWRSRRIFGYVGSTDETVSGNSTWQAYRFEVVSKIPYLEEAHSASVTDGITDAGALSWLWIKTRCYSSSGLVPPNTAIRLGTFAQGIASACYNGRE